MHSNILGNMYDGWRHRISAVSTNGLIGRTPETRARGSTPSILQPTPLKRLRMRVHSSYSSNPRTPYAYHCTLAWAPGKVFLNPTRTFRGSDVWTFFQRETESKKRGRKIRHLGQGALLDVKQLSNPSGTLHGLNRTGPNSVEPGRAEDNGICLLIPSSNKIC